MFGIDDAAIALLIAGGLSTAGSLYANTQNAKLQAAQLDYQKYVNDVNWQIARTNNATQIEMANSAHQREVADLRAAGLNPILSAGGSGAYTPSLTTGDGRGTNLGSPYANPLEGLANSASGVARFLSQQYKQQLEQSKQDIALTKEQSTAVSIDNQRESARRDLDTFETELKNDALHRAAGWYTDPDTGYRAFVDKKKYNDYVNEVAAGYVSNAKMLANQNWRANFDLARKGFDTAIDVYRGVRGLPKRGGRGFFER